MIELGRLKQIFSQNRKKILQIVLLYIVLLPFFIFLLFNVTMPLLISQTPYFIVDSENKIHDSAGKMYTQSEYFLSIFLRVVMMILFIMALIFVIPIYISYIMNKYFEKQINIFLKIFYIFFLALGIYTTISVGSVPQPKIFDPYSISLGWHAESFKSKFSGYIVDVIEIDVGYTKFTGGIQKIGWTNNNHECYGIKGDFICIGVSKTTYHEETTIELIW